MSSMAEFITDFLEIVGNKEEYNKYQWSEENLPDFETMLRVKQENKLTNEK
tara:strand:- start:43 stop:195 length:153 start_codon:yes stop_codon:yes gene_type:complete